LAGFVKRIKCIIWGWWVVAREAIDPASAVRFVVSSPFHPPAPHRFALVYNWHQSG
jgi:hypothetical protein